MDTRSLVQRRGVRVALAAALLLACAAVVAFYAATQLLKSRVERALGPTAQVGHIGLGWNGVVINSLRLPARPGEWPAGDQLRASRIVVVPQLRDLVSGNVRIASVTLDGAYLSMLRERDGRLRVLPGVLDVAAKTGGAGGAGAQSDVPANPFASPAIDIGEIRLRDATIDFFDASIRRPPHRLRLSRIDGSLKHLRLPSLQGMSTLAFAGTLEGAQRNGEFSLGGSIELASKESDLRMRIVGADMVALQPYLLRATETGVRRGSLDLTLRATVQQRRLHAPGQLVLSGLELAPSGSTFMGMPQQAVVGVLRDRAGRISVDFALDGNLDDPRFSLNENMAIRLTAAVANSLGISVEGLARGVASIGSGAARGVADAIGKVFGR